MQTASIWIYDIGMPQNTNRNFLSSNMTTQKSGTLIVNHCYCTFPAQKLSCLVTRWSSSSVLKGRKYTISLILPINSSRLKVFFSIGWIIESLNSRDNSVCAKMLRVSDTRTHIVMPQKDNAKNIRIVHLDCTPSKAYVLAE